MIQIDCKDYFVNICPTGTTLTTVSKHPDVLTIDDNGELRCSTKCFKNENPCCLSCAISGKYRVDNCYFAKRMTTTVQMRFLMALEQAKKDCASEDKL